MKAILVQPPFTQLNAPYPAVHYLEAFLRGRGATAASFDHSIALYRRIFSREGLAKVFAEAREALDARDAAEDRDAGGGRGKGPGIDAESRTQIGRYLSYGHL